MRKILASLALLLASASLWATTLAPIQLLNPTGSTSGQAIVSTGSSTAPAWGNVTAGALAAQAANTVLANVTASSASPTAFAMPSCSTSSSALQYTSGTGFTCYANSATTTGTLAQFAATTSAQLAGVISDETGSGSLVFGTSPTINTPTISGGTVNNATIGQSTPLAGSFTTLSATGNFTPSQTNGIVGTTTNNNANAGSVGEFTPNTATAVSLTNATSANITSISLTAGDWDVSGVVHVIPAGTTVVSGYNIGISTTSATLGDDTTQFSDSGFTKSAGFGGRYVTPVVRISVASTTTVYLVGQVNFTTSTCTANGYIRARRVR